MAIKIIRPGIFTTIQDAGRTGYRSIGIGPGGAMDFFASAVANFLVGNDTKSAVIEMHFPGPEILFDEPALISVTGADFSLYINDQPAGLWTPVLINKGDKLSFKRLVSGARAYLAASGGFQINQWLNSFSTHTKIKAGGHQGRVLMKEDTLLLNSPLSLFPLIDFPPVAPLIGPVYDPAGNIRVIAGPEWHWQKEASKSIFLNTSFTITPQSDRMGYRLNGNTLDQLYTEQLISSPLDHGTIQLLPNGQLIVLMADHQTTGGYPRIANVITADLPGLAQLPIHSKLQFEMVTIENAEQALISLHQRLALIQNICKNIYDTGRH